jgi:hypothetical protein
MLEALDKMIEIFLSTSNDVDKSFDELEKYEINLTLKEPDIFQVENSLEGDKWAMELLKENDLQYRRRLYIRTFFSHVEGVLWGLSQLSIASGNQNLTKETLLQLEEKKEVQNNGQTEIRYSRQSLGERIKFVINSFAIAMDVKLNSYFADQDWMMFQAAIQMRDNITHPKDKCNLLITKDDIDKVHRSNKWFSKIVDELLSKWN